MLESLPNLMPPLAQTLPDMAADARWDVIANIGYLLAAVLFILGMKGMTHPRTAVRGNLLGACGMLVAVVVTLLKIDSPSIFGIVLVGLAVGSVIGVFLAVKIQMTQMPQLVALYNGLGGGASVLVAGAEVIKGPGGMAASWLLVPAIAAAISGVIGAVTLSGSLVAAGKLEELKSFKNPISFTAHQAMNVALVMFALLLAWWMIGAEQPWAYALLVLVSLALGIMLVLPIGGADMPVVIALLNSYSGLAAAATGFVIGNNVLIVAGSLVGASGLILTQIMCRAMNRSLTNVLFGVMDGGGTVADQDEVYAGKIKSTTADEVAMLLDGVRRVVVVPGYGLAVAQAQHTVRDLATILEQRGTEVEYAIHPVAGRMPGHMNVLLAEADVPYDKLKEMDEINPTFAQCDVAIVIGANDVVNPVANTDPTSPIAGMPILEVGKANTVVVIKRSLSPGFAGIPNPLFAADNCLMLFGDGKQALLDLVGALKETR
ncbi:MAG: NAD(P)(+) transhydrogenase (Re/Si-specific) subunit beta [Pirellulales bacterium]